MRKLRVWTLALPLAALFIVSPRLTANRLPDSDKVTTLLSEAKTISFELKEDAVMMAGFPRMNLSVESHAIAINQVRDHVNELSKKAAQLQEIKAIASPWQRTAIDRMQPYLDELEGYTMAVIERINDKPKLLNTPEYKDYLEANADYSSDLAAMIAQFVDYGRTKDRLQEITDKLELPRR